MTEAAAPHSSEPPTNPDAARPPVANRTVWAWTVATFFGAGLGKPGPGTWGSVAALLLWAAFARFLHPSPAALLIALIVIDEVAGQWIALLGSPADWKHAVIALLLFRLFDITKPFPARQLESLPEGWGIVFDDVAAGLYAWGVAAILRFWI
jgi:phosphatidylglycerophosphatase A